MIIVRLMGGMGNQMFQYAAGKYLSEKWGVPLKLDLSFLNDRAPKENFTYRDFELHAFNINDEIIQAKELELFVRKAVKLSKLKIDGLNRVLFKFSIPFPKIINHHYSSFYEYFPSLSNNTFLIGYWQSEKYFENFGDLIRQCFLLQDPGIEKRVASFLQRDKMREKVSVHIRRGDYILNDHINSVHGLCSKDYYIEAMDYISAKVQDPIFYFVSDDMDWVKSTFIKFLGKYKIIFAPSDHGPLDDLQVMKLCRHNIIANSSFSWWGAWLNENPQKIVIAPKKWFADESKDTTGIIPAKWIQL